MEMRVFDRFGEVIPPPKAIVGRRKPPAPPNLKLRLDTLRDRIMAAGLDQEPEAGPPQELPPEVAARPFPSLRPKPG